jgi:hypothetical protein
VRVPVAATAQAHVRIVLPLPSESKGHTFESCRVRFFLFYSGICAPGLKLQLCVIRVRKRLWWKNCRRMPMLRLEAAPHNNPGAQSSLRRSDAVRRGYPDDKIDHRYRQPARDIRAQPHHRRQERACQHEGDAADLTNRASARSEALTLSGAVAPAAAWVRTKLW